MADNISRLTTSPMPFKTVHDDTEDLVEVLVDVARPGGGLPDAAAPEVEVDCARRFASKVID